MPTQEVSSSQDQLFSPIKNSIRASIPVSSPPDIGADLVASQKKKTYETMTGGMLDALRLQTKSLNSLTKMRNTRKK